MLKNLLTVSLFPWVLTSTVTMTAPRRANFWAMSRPIPDPPPVIRTTSPRTLFPKNFGFSPGAKWGACDMERKSCWRMKHDWDRPSGAYLYVVHFALSSSIIFAPYKNLPTLKSNAPWVGYCFHSYSRKIEKLSLQSFPVLWVLPLMNSLPP